MQPTPEIPINVETKNPYIGLDRGLFLVHSNAGVKLGRIHAARYTTKGPNAAVGMMEYKVMSYAQSPTTAAQYAAGEILKAPDGSEWFDCLVRGPVLTPITAEYWGCSSYLSWYHGKAGIKLESIEKETIFEQGTVFTKTMGSFAGLADVQLTATFDAVAGQPLTRTSAVLEIDYTRDGVTKQIEETNLPVGEFDPVRLALGILRTK